MARLSKSRQPNDQIPTPENWNLSDVTICLLKLGIYPLAEKLEGKQMGDTRDDLVFATQKWLNERFGTAEGWVPLEEDGRTGWQTIYGLRRGLQAILGVFPLSSGFGPATTAAEFGNLKWPHWRHFHLAQARSDLP